MIRLDTNTTHFPSEVLILLDGTEPWYLCVKNSLHLVRRCLDVSVLFIDRMLLAGDAGRLESSRRFAPEAARDGGFIDTDPPCDSRGGFAVVWVRTGDGSVGTRELPIVGRGSASSSSISRIKTSVSYTHLTLPTICSV